MTLTKAQEMVAENRRNGSIQAFAEGKEVERENCVRPGLWHPPLSDEAFLPDQYRYRVKRTPSEWWEVRTGRMTVLDRFSLLSDAQRAAMKMKIEGCYIVHVREVIE